ncbi:hypothetical protein SISNIDRAFT_456913 [Sistotremastrum niveocremeum HHB9708]|uniref:F-box domain-containing protein n=1 Tax=Sistotremastrum niveocremeum HHB9708 TaxID=1314777 RepID=A0A164SAM9_9AGAM|nr:hypothetical protein SISNIDRAFT_456913 [Sistotremastrum niveocremeum HHB9708]
MFFPPELVALVLEELFSSSEDEFDRCKDLTSIALTCRSFHEQAEPLLYRSITFRLGTKRALKIAQRLQSGRAIFVQELCIEINKDPTLSRRRRPPANDKNELYTSYTKLPFNLMSNLRVFSLSHTGNAYSIHGHDHDNFMQADKAIDKLLNDSLPENVLHKFSHVHPYGAADMSFLSRQNELRCLTLHEMPREPQSTVLMNTLASLPKLRHLELAKVIHAGPVFPPHSRMAQFSLKLRDIRYLSRLEPGLWGSGAQQFTILDLSCIQRYSRNIRLINMNTSGSIQGIANEFLNLKLLRLSWDLLSETMDAPHNAWRSLSSLHRLEAIEVYIRDPHPDMFQRHHHHINSLLQNYTGHSLQSILVNCDKPPWPSYEMVRSQGMGWDQICPVDAQDWLVRYTERSNPNSVSEEI